MHYDDRTVDAFQEINPVMLEAIDGVRGTPGQLIMHEITEAIVGADIAMRTEQSTPAAARNRYNPVYDQAHSSSSTQPQGDYLDIIVIQQKVEGLNIHKTQVIDFQGNEIWSELIMY